MRTAFMLAAGLVLMGAPAYAQPSTAQAQPDGSGAGKNAIGGVVNANGTTQGSPTAFTVSHPSTGRYVITFTTAFKKEAICTFTSVGAGAHVAGLGVNSKVCDVTFVTNSSGATVDELFVFVAANLG